jgi:hypothetical protein
MMRFFDEVPAERLALVRILVGAYASVYLLVRAPVLADFRGMAEERFEPVGLAALLDAPLSPTAALVAWAACWLLCVAFTLGVWFRVIGPLCALALLWVTSYRTSWGMVFHTDNLLAMHVLALGFVPACAESLSLDARKRVRPAPDARFGWPLWLMSAITVVAYLLAGVAKLKISGLHWADGEVLRSTMAHDAVRKAAVGSIHSPLGAWLVQYGWPFPVLGAMTLVLELGAPLALLGRRVAAAWVLGIWSFHLGVIATMAIAFPYPLSGIAFASFFPLEGWLAPDAKLGRFLRRSPALANLLARLLAPASALR